MKPKKKIKMHSFITSKKDGKWYAQLYKWHQGWEMVRGEKVEADSFLELSIEIGNKGWIDDINKNK